MSKWDRKTETGIRRQNTKITLADTLSYVLATAEIRTSHPNVAQHLYRHQITTYQTNNVVSRPIFNALSIELGFGRRNWTCSDYRPLHQQYLFLLATPTHIMMQPSMMIGKTYQLRHIVLSLTPLNNMRRDEALIDGVFRQLMICGPWRDKM